MKRLLIMLTCGPQKFDSFCFKSVVCFIFSSKMFHIFKIFAHVSSIRPLNIKKLCKMMEYILPCGQKSDVINVIWASLIINILHNHKGGSQKLMFVDMGGGRALETPKNCNI